MSDHTADTEAVPRAQDSMLALSRPRIIILFGRLNVVCGVCGCILSLGMNSDHVFDPWSPLFLAAGISAIIHGHGLLLMKRWARIGSIAIGVGCSVLFVTRMLNELKWFASRPYAITVPDGAVLTLVTVAGFIYPVALVYFMTRSHVVATFDILPVTVESPAQTTDNEERKR